jgi:hypothetical protein
MGVRVRWHKGAYYLFLNLGGRRKAIKVGSDKRVANSAAGKLRKAIGRGEYRIPDKTSVAPTFASLAREWLERYPMIHDVRPATMRNYAGAVKHHLSGF